ncbi:MAG: hypothetical protein ACTHJR_17510 [Sphingomonas sp.]|uniref:hypothetical protein n=1 Tax=Sphingomonas sp. TaxID=28214 RepID=UPI003F7CD8BE
MSVSNANIGSKKRSARVTVRKTGGKTRAVTFGSVTVRAAKPPEADIEKNVASGQSALARARATMLKPGVRLSTSRDVPLYHVDPNKPDEVIRKLGGKTERGRFVNGAFQKQ